MVNAFQRQRSGATSFYELGRTIAQPAPVVARTHLREIKVWGNDEPLFPATDTKVGESGQFEVVDFKREHWSNAAPVQTIFRKAFREAGHPYFNPHSLRDTPAMEMSARNSRERSFEASPNRVDRLGRMGRKWRKSQRPSLDSCAPQERFRSVSGGSLSLGRSGIHLGARAETQTQRGCDVPDGGNIGGTPSRSGCRARPTHELEGECDSWVVKHPCAHWPSRLARIGDDVKHGARRRGIGAVTDNNAGRSSNSAMSDHAKISEQAISIPMPSLMPQRRNVRLAP